MSPLELSYKLNGIPQQKITTKDGVMAILETPAGVAMAKLLPNGRSWFTKAAVIDRLGALFPGDPQTVSPYSDHGDGLHYHINSIFDYFIPRERKLMAAKKVFRKKTVQTAQGEVEIEAVGFDEPQNSSVK